MSKIVVRKLDAGNDRSTFSCGDPSLDRFFRQFAGQNQFKHHLGTTYIAEEGALLGFVTLTPSQIDGEDLAAKVRKRLPKYPIPVLRLARLGVSEAAQGRGIGKLLLKHVFVLAWQLADDFGCTGVIVDAKPDAVDFYAKYGFVALDIVAGELGDRPVPTVMFLPLGAIPTA